MDLDTQHLTLYYFCGSLDSKSESGSGSTAWLNPDPARIRNTDTYYLCSLQEGALFLITVSRTTYSDRLWTVLKEGGGTRMATQHSVIEQVFVDFGRCC